MQRFALIIIVFISSLNCCFAQTKITVGNLSYSIKKNTKPVELMPAAVAYPKTGGGHIVSARFPGYKYLMPVNGSGWYPGWSGDANEITGVITVTSPRGYTYTFDNGDDPNNKAGMELKLTEIKDPNNNSEGIFSYYSNGSLYRITENSSQDSVYMQFSYDSGRLLSITAFDPSAVAGSNYSRVYSLVYDSNDRVVSTTSSTSGCGCSGTGSDWLTDVYDANNRLVDQNDSSEQTIYSYNYHSDGTLHEKKNKDGNLIKNVEFEDILDGTKKRKTYDYVDPYNYRYSEKLIDTDGSVISDTVFKELRDTRVDPNLYDSNSFTTRYLYNGDDKTVIPDDGNPNGNGTRTVYDYDSSHKLLNEDQYDSNNIGRTIVSNNYSNDRLSDTTDIRGNQAQYEYIENSSLIYKQLISSEDLDYYYRYIYDSQNRKIIEELRQDDASANDEDDPIVQTTHFEYDNYGNICKEYRNGISDRSEPNSFVTEYVYNAFGNLLWQINPDGVVKGKTYDAAGRVENEFVLAGGIAVFSQIENPLNLDLNGLEVVSQTNYQYHSVYGKIEVVSVAVDSDVFNLNSPDEWNATLYGYDSYGRKISEVKDYENTNITTGYQYNIQNEVEIVTYSDDHTEETVKDGRGLTLQSIKSGGSESITTDYAYDGRGNLIQTKIADTIVNSLQYDDYGRKITSFNGDFNDVHFTQYIYDGTTDDIETVKVWDIDTNNDPVIIRQTLSAYDLSGRVIFQQGFVNPSSSNGLNDKIMFYRYDVLGNLIMTAYKGVGNSWDSIYDYYPDTYGGYDGDIIELRKYNGNLQLSAVIKFEYPQIPDMYYDETLQDYVWDFFDSNLADAESYILQNDPDIYYIKYEYINSQLASQSLYAGIDPNTDELTFSKKTSYDYDLAGRTTRAYDADDNYTQIAYNSLNQPTEQTLLQGKSILRFSDSNGYDPNFVPYAIKRSLTAYDGMGRKTRSVILSDPNINIGIDDVNLAVDKVISYVYDANGNLYREKEVFGKSEYGDDRISLKAYSYDDLGRVSLVLYGELNEYYFGGQLLGEETLPLKYITYHYNDMGQMDTQTVTDVNTIDLETTAEFDTHYEYDNQGRVKEIQNAIGILGQYFYDTIGRKYKEINFAGMVTINNYNGLGYPTSTVEDANNQQQPRTTTFGYDRNGRRTSISSVNDSTVYTYNYLDKVTSITYTDDKEISYGYDMEGNVIRRTITENSTSVTTNYKRDIMGRVCYKQYSNDPNWNDPNTFWPFDEILYDAAGNKWLMANIDDGNDSEFVCFMYDGLGNMSSSSESYPEVNYEVSYGYDSRGLLKSIYYPDESVIIYTRDALGRVETVSYNGDTVVQYYWLGDKVIKKIIGGIEYTADIDSLGRIGAEEYGDLTFDYGYLNHTSRLIDRNGITYSYDTLGRVTYEESTHYTYDLLGNPANAGNDGLTYTMDDEDRIVDVNDTSGDVAQYSYDRTGRRISKTIGETKTYFAYDKFGNVIAEYIRDGNETVWQKDYVYGASGELIYMQLPAISASSEDLDEFIDFCNSWLCYPDCDSNDLYWDDNNDMQINFVDWAAHMEGFELAFNRNGRYILTDLMGSVVGVSDGSNTTEITYNAWGVPSYTGDLDGLNILWNGYYSDEETGNYYLRNRYYSPLERKFITQDPRGINPDGNWNNVFNIFNQYKNGYGLRVYCQSNPLNKKDSWGLMSVIDPIEPPTPLSTSNTNCTKWKNSGEEPKIALVRETGCREVQFTLPPSIPIIDLIYEIVSPSFTVCDLKLTNSFVVNGQACECLWKAKRPCQRECCYNGTYWKNFTKYSYSGKVTEKKDQIQYFISYGAAWESYWNPTVFQCGCAAPGLSQVNKCKN